MGTYTIRKGYDIPIRGKAPETLGAAKKPTRVAIQPVDFRGLRPRLLVDVGTPVRIGTPLVEDKIQSQLKVVSPAAGKVVEIRRGLRRRLEEIVVEINPEEAEDSVHFSPYTDAQLFSLTTDIAISALLEGGLWPYLRQRPFAKIANPEQIPQAIFINAMDTEPLAANPAFLLQGQIRFFNAGLEILKKLTQGNLHLCLPAQGQTPLSSVEESNQVRLHRFKGPHPAGSVGTHIQMIEPLRKEQVHWYLRATEVAYIGRFFLEGVFPVERVIAVAGEGATQPGYYTSRLGAPVESLWEGTATGGRFRIISGSVLTGRQVSADGFMGFYDQTLTIIPEGGKRSFLGWLSPGWKSSSASRAYISSFLAKKEYSFDTSLNGSQRAIVPIGNYESVMALDIQPTFLFKALLNGDLEEAAKLGLLECAEEDVALCSYVCHSKMDFCSLLRRSLDDYEKEG